MHTQVANAHTEKTCNVMKNIENKVLPLLSSPSTTEMLCLPQRRLLRRHLCPHPRHLLVLHQSLDYIQETLNYLPQLSIFLRYKPGSSSEPQFGEHVKFWSPRGSERAHENDFEGQLISITRLPRNLQIYNFNILKK